MIDPIRSTPREWVALATTSALMIFAQGTVFAALGVVLFAMAQNLGWSAAQAGAGFTLVVFGACVAALLAAVAMRRIGARWTLALGGFVLAVAFWIASLTQHIATLYAAAALAGIGFSLSANTPGIYLIAGWAGGRAPRMIGLYLMFGMFGNAIGPPLAQALCGGAGGWRFYWRAMAMVALILTAACMLLLREPPHAVETPPTPAIGDHPARPLGPGIRQILTAPAFVVMALAMVATQACVVTVASVTTAHFAGHGWPATYAAWMLGVQGLAGALATGASGFLTRQFPPERMLTMSLALTAVGMVLLAIARSSLSAYGFALTFGIGSCVVTLAVAILLVRYFGHAGGATGLAMIWTLAGGAAIGPWLAGRVADSVGSFGPALAGLGLMLIPIAGATLLIRAPRAAI